VPVVPTGIDLAAAAVTSPKQAAAGKAIALSARISNRGSKRFDGKVQIGFYLSKDKTWDAADVLVRTYTTPAVKLSGKKYVTASVKGIVPKAVVTGKYHVLAVVDPAQRVAEDNEANNVAAAAAVLPVDGAKAAKLKPKVRKSAFSTLPIK